MKLTRHQLYARVWEKPMTQLSKEFGLSDVGLAKICRKSGIPLPERGYWAKVAAGYRGAKRALPRKDYDPEIEIFDREPITDQAIQEKQVKKSQQKEQVAAIGTIEIPDQLTNPHRLTKMTLLYFVEILKKVERQSKMKDLSKIDWRDRPPSQDNGRYQSWPEHGYELRVSMECLNRALCFLDVLVKQLELNGFEIQQEFKGRMLRDQLIEAVKDDERIRFQMSEGYKQRMLTLDELKEAREQRSWASAQERVASGIFTFTLKGCVAWQEKKYVDGSKKIEEQLPHIINEFINRVAREKEARIEKAKAKQDWEERERVRIKAQRKSYEQQRQFDEAIKEAERIKELEQLEAYLVRLESEHRTELGEPHQHVQAWFQMVRSIADQKNPLKNRLEYLAALRTYDAEKIDWI